MTVLSAIVDVVVALVGFGGGCAVALITQKHTDKRQDMELDAERGTKIDEKIREIDKKHSNDLAEIKKEYQDEFKEIKKLLSEMKSEYNNVVSVISLKIDNLEKAQNKHNDVITRTFKLEERMTLTEEKVNVANKRIADLERHEEKNVYKEGK